MLGCDNAVKFYRTSAVEYLFGGGIAMCMMLYLGSRRPLSLRRSACLALEPVSEAVQVVREQVRRDYVYFVGSYLGCSCGFPSVQAEEEIEYFDGVFKDESSERDKDLASVRELVTVIDEALEGQADCVLFPVWTGSEGAAPKGDVRWNRKAMSPERFLLTEQFRYTIHAEPSDSPNGGPATRLRNSEVAEGPPSVS